MQKCTPEGNTGSTEYKTVLDRIKKLNFLIYFLRSINVLILLGYIYIYIFISCENIERTSGRNTEENKIRKVNKQEVAGLPGDIKNLFC